MTTTASACGYGSDLGSGMIGKLAAEELFGDGERGQDSLTEDSKVGRACQAWEVAVGVESGVESSAEPDTRNQPTNP